MFYHALTGNGGNTTSIIPFDAVPTGFYVEINISNDCEDFRTLSIDNLYVQFTNLRHYSSGDVSEDFTVSYEYNNTTGIIKATTSVDNAIFATNGTHIKGSVIIVR